MITQSKYAQKGGAYRYSEGYSDWKSAAVSGRGNIDILADKHSIKHFGIRGNQANGDVIEANGRIMARRYSSVA